MSREAYSAGVSEGPLSGGGELSRRHSPLLPTNPSHFALLLVLGPVQLSESAGQQRSQKVLSSATEG